MQLSQITQDSAKPVNKDRHAGVLADLPRRQFIDASTGDVSLSQMRFVSFKVNYLRAMASFFRWLQLLLNFFLSIFTDFLSGRDSQEQRARRLRHAFEREGGSFVKLGIH